MERYDIICGDMWRSKNGDYVRYLEARAKIERLTSIVCALTERVDGARDAADKYCRERDEARAQVAAAYETAANTAESRYDCAPSDCFCSFGKDRQHRCVNQQRRNTGRAIRALTPADAQAALEAYGREKVREGMQRAADLCKPAKAKMDWGNKWEPARKNPQSAAAQGARKQCYNAILAAMEKEGGE